MSQHDTTLKAGLASAILAYTLWGFFPIYFKVAHEVPALEFLAHRIIWSVPFGALILTFRNQWKETRAVFTRPAVLAGLGAAATIIAINWGFYIWAVQQERIFEASLGYYINPLIFVLIGVFVNRENLRRAQWAAVALASAGVLVLTFYGGIFPWVSLVLAGSFTIYGYLRKRISIGAMPGLFIETVLLFLPALGYWLWLNGQGAAVFDLARPGLAGIILLAGPFTVLPLLFFAIGARRLNLSTIGFLQFIGPTLQFMVGLYYGENFTPAHAVCFGLIWCAVAVFSLDAWRSNRKPKMVTETV